MTRPLRPVSVRRVDWFRVLADLKRAGLSLGMVASLTGVSKSVLVGLRNTDADPKMRAGEAIVALWVNATGQKRDDLPRWGDEYKPRSSTPERQWDAGAQAWCPLCGAEHRVSAGKGAPQGPKPAAAPLAREGQMGLWH